MRSLKARRCDTMWPHKSVYRKAPITTVEKWHYRLLNCLTPYRVLPTLCQSGPQTKTARGDVIPVCETGKIDILSFEYRSDSPSTGSDNCPRIRVQRKRGDMKDDGKALSSQRTMSCPLFMRRLLQVESFVNCIGLSTINIGPDHLAVASGAISFGQCKQKVWPKPRISLISTFWFPANHLANLSLCKPGLEFRLLKCLVS